ncbi:hypothetical protein JCM10213v2_003982 [Rhodosporidiobolus nylandii]
MAAVRQHGARNDLFQSKQPYHDSMPPTKGAKQRQGGAAYGEGIAISYDLHEQEPVYRADIKLDSMGWERNNVPLSRNKPSNGFLSAYDAANDQSNRVDSVFDAYVDMYADEQDEVEDFGEDATEGLHVPSPASLRAPSSHATRQSFEQYEEPAAAREPWDERGKTGLYGGGGRGADDRETGWVRDYAFSPQQQPGFEEDISYEGADEDVGPGGHTGVRAAQGDRRDEERRRSSPETAPSSYGPVTPISATFPSQTAEPQYGDGGYRSTNSPPQASSSSRSRLALHTINPALDKKTGTGIAVPVPSRPMPLSTPAAPSTPSIKVIPSTASERPRRKSAFSRWGSRGKKAPAISAPILPQGFVESLGMETFALYPGCKPPSHAILSPVPREPGSPAAPTPRQTSTSPARAVSPPTARVGTPASLRTTAAYQQNSGVRPRNLSPVKAGPERSQRSVSPDGPAPVRLTRRDDNDAASEGYPEDAFRRLSRNSDGSYAAGNQSTRTTHRKFFNGIRQEHSRYHEVQANRAVVPSNAPVIPPIPSARSRDPLSGDGDAAPAFSPQVSFRSDGSGTVDGFRDPWSSSVPSSRSSGHSQRTTMNRDSSHPGNRASLASTAHEHDYRKGSYVSSRSRLPPHAEQGAGDFNPYAVPQPQMASFDQQSPYSSPHARDRRNDSLSSQYSEASEAPPQNDFHPRAHPGFAPPTAASHLRKTSLAEKSLAPPSSAASHSHELFAAPPAVAPLKLSRRPSHVYGGHKLGGDVIWGGAGVGGPKDTAASPMPDCQGSTMHEAPTIGTTGFRNPFG